MNSDEKAAKIISEALKFNPTAEKMWALGYICCKLDVSYDDITSGAVLIKLSGTANNVLRVIKEIRTVISIGLKECKEICDGVRELELTSAQWFSLRQKLDSLGVGYSVRDG